MNKNVLKFIVLVSWPFFIFIGVYLWKQPQLKEKERQKRQELLSDTDAVNQAFRTYKRVHHQLLMKDTDFVLLYEENQELKDRLQRIKEYAGELEDCLFYYEQKGLDVSELKDAIVNITSECE